ncbi:forkhead box protein P1 isoform X1 [Osmerus mordax]|uniref:forkhead box protein P1 isoform X1 n=1 Tax=Osmerus mordax TaxID=8014 RepID=UPI00350EB024
MPQTESERLKCGRVGRERQQQAELHEHGDVPGKPQPPPRDFLSPQPSTYTSGAQCTGDDQRRQVSKLLPARSQSGQHRPSVLRQAVRTTHRRHHVEPGSAQAIAQCKAEVETGMSHQQFSLLQSGPSPRHIDPTPSSRRDGLLEASIFSKHQNGPSLPNPGSVGTLFLNGLCRWPGCDSVFEEFNSFLKHLHADHSYGDKSIAQWRIQQDMVQYMESQLTLEKQKLFEMQLHLHLSQNKSTDLRAGLDWPYSLALITSQARAADGDQVPHCATKEPEELAQHEFWPAGTAHLLPESQEFISSMGMFLLGCSIDVVPGIQCYKYNNIRPPYTYACLIRWSILESPDKQRTLNEIYNWFTTMFFYFRHNTATWKNAVRHNLSLHKCFVRVEGGKGAVWTVDETEYQMRKGQKYYRDHPVKWLTPYSFFRPEEP